MLKPIALKLAMLLLLALNCACFYQQRVMPPSELPLVFSGRIEILTNDGTRYRLNDAVVGLNDISGYGWKFPVEGHATSFSGSVSCNDIALVQTEKPLVWGSLLAWGTIGIVAGHILASPGETPQLIEDIQYPSSGGGSCPYVYSFDGDNYQLESETFAGAVCPSLERTAVDPLRHLKAVDGTFSLAIANQSPESQHTNELKLIAVQHAPGTTIIPDSWGGFHSVTAAVQPLTAIDAAGRDVSSLVTDNDSERWGSDLTDTISIRENAFRNRLTCSFRLPNGSGPAKLILNARNSSLGFFALGKLFALKGPQKLDWFHELENDRTVFGKLATWIKREGGMTIAVLTHEGWQTQAWIPDVGPQLDAERAVVLDCSDCSDSLVQIRLESAAGLWLINRLALDWSDDTPLVTTDLKLLNATNQRGADITSLLNRRDSHYYATIPGDFATVTYEAPEPVAGMVQTIMLSSRGHYFPWFTADSVVSPDRFEAIMSRPGYGSDLYWQEWYRDREHWDSFYAGQPTFSRQSGPSVQSCDSR